MFVDLEKCPTEMGSFSILVSVLCPDKNSSPFLNNVSVFSVFELFATFKQRRTHRYARSRTARFLKSS